MQRDARQASLFQVSSISRTRIWIMPITLLVYLIYQAICSRVGSCETATSATVQSRVSIVTQHPLQLDHLCHRPKKDPGIGRRVRSAEGWWMPSATWIPPQEHPCRPSGRGGRLFIPLLCLSWILCHVELLSDGQSRQHRAALQVRGHRGGGQSQRVNRWAHPKTHCSSHPAQVIHRWQNS